MTARKSKQMQILEVARALLEEEGAARVSVAAVAKAAGVTRQAIYLHFGDRAGLLVALVDYVDAQEGLPQVYERIFSAGSALEMLDRVVELQPVYYPRIRAVAAALESARHTDAAAAKAWENRAQMRLAGGRMIIERLREEGQLAARWTVERAADVAWALTSIEVWRDLMVERGWPADVYVEHMKQTLRRVLCGET